MNTQAQRVDITRPTNLKVRSRKDPGRSVKSSIGMKLDDDVTFDSGWGCIVTGDPDITKTAGAAMLWIDTGSIKVTARGSEDKVELQISVLTASSTGSAGVEALTASDDDDGSGRLH